jgi:DNA-binding NarL/FixJ family response regulator
VRWRTVFAVYTRCDEGTNVQMVPFPVAGSFPHGSDPACNPPRRAGGCMSIKILIADDSPSIRYLLRLFIEHATDWDVCGEAENGEIAVEKVKKLKPHAVILDLSMPVMNGLEAAREITRIAPNVQMVMFTMHISEQLREDARAAGIKDVISKSDTIRDHLLPSLRNACAGRASAA